jgi:ribosomal protein L24E
MGEQLHYHLCPRCYRATPAGLGEVYCPNDGSKLLTNCPRCATSITSPYSRYCTYCGHNFHPSDSSLFEGTTA